MCGHLNLRDLGKYASAPATTMTQIGGWERELFTNSSLTSTQRKLGQNHQKVGLGAECVPISQSGLGLGIPVPTPWYSGCNEENNS